jgi:hypothetical protein
MRALFPYPRRLVLFAVLSLGDLVLTCYLLYGNPGQVYESNPIADWWFMRFGWVGLAGFKAAAVLVVAGLAAVVSLRQWRKGGQILSFACSMVAVVLLYSCGVAGHIHSSAADDLPQVEAQARHLDGIVLQGRRYQALIEQLSRHLIDDGGELAPAVTVLARSEKGRDTNWLRLLRASYPGYSDRECLAINLMKSTVLSLKDSKGFRLLTDRFEADFQAIFGRPAPEGWPQRTNFRPGLASP